MKHACRWIRNDRVGVGALVIYSVLSFLVFGRGLVGHFSNRYVGAGQDPGAFILFFEWWKYSLGHHLNPFLTHMVWAPGGTNLAWDTIVPLFGITMIPVTAGFGPVVSYNLVMLACPALAAWTAFHLCRYLRTGFWASLVGGYMFGFSPYMLAHMLGHANLSAVFAIPVMVELALLELNGSLGRGAFVWWFSLLVVVQFLCFPETLATAAVFGAIAMAVAWKIAPVWRGRLNRLIVLLVFANLIGSLVFSPYLYYFFAFGQPPFPGGMRSVASVNPLNLLIASQTNLLGMFALFPPLLTGHIYEAGAYLAIPTLLIVIGYVYRHWCEWRARLLVNMLAVVTVASLGSSVAIGGIRPIPMPWAIATHLPLINKALPARFSVYACLTIAILVSLWLSDDAVGKRLRVAGAFGVVLFTLPNPSIAFWTTRLDTPAFFSTGEFKHYIAPGDNVLILPYGEIGNSNIWQATAGFYFRMAGGYVGQPPIPNAYLPYFPIVYDLANLTDSPLSGEMLKTFLAQQDIREIVVADEGTPLWLNSLEPGLRRPRLAALDENERVVIDTLLGTLGVKPVRVGGVSCYRVPLERLTAYRTADPGALEARSVAMQLSALIEAAQMYIAEGRSLAKLNPFEVQRLGLLPPRWICGVGISDPRAPIHNGLVISSIDAGNILIGVIGAQTTVQGLAEEYRSGAKRVEVSPLIGMAAKAESSRSMLLLEYEPAQLERAAAIAASRKASAN